MARDQTGRRPGSSSWRHDRRGSPPGVQWLRRMMTHGRAVGHRRLEADRSRRDAVLMQIARTGDRARQLRRREVPGQFPGCAVEHQLANLAETYLFECAAVVEFGEQFDEPFGSFADCLLIDRRGPVCDCGSQRVVVCGGEGSTAEGLAFGGDQGADIVLVGSKSLELRGEERRSVRVGLGGAVGLDVMEAVVEGDELLR